MTELLLEYPYKARPGAMLASIALFGASAAEMAYTALANERGLILNGVFTFSVNGATTFYWSVAAVCLLFVLMAIIVLATSWANPGILRLTNAELSFPTHGFVRKPVAIPLSEIANIDVHTIYNQRFIYVYHARGKFSVAQSMLPNSEAFERLYAALIATAGGKNRLSAS